jgi:hypothetical protein
MNTINATMEIDGKKYEISASGKTKELLLLDFIRRSSELFGGDKPACITKGF